MKKFLIIQIICLSLMSITVNAHAITFWNWSESTSYEANSIYDLAVMRHPGSTSTQLDGWTGDTLTFTNSFRLSPVLHSANLDFDYYGNFLGTRYVYWLYPFQYNQSFRNGNLYYTYDEYAIRPHCVYPQEGGGDCNNFELYSIKPGDSNCASGIFDPQQGKCVPHQTTVDSSRDDGVPECAVGNPINVANGNKYEEENDYSGSEIFPLELSRFYNSHIGKWSYSYSRNVKLDAYNQNQALVRRDDGALYKFTKISDYRGVTWQSNTQDVRDILSAQLDSLGNVSGWQYKTLSGDVESYNANGKLISIKRKGITQTIQYIGNTANISVFGHTLTLTFNGVGDLVGMKDPVGNQVSYLYDANQNLQYVVYPNSKTRQYLYENNNFPHALTGIIDENNNRFATWIYDDQGRGILSEHANGVERSAITYNTDGSTTVVNELGKSTTFYFGIFQGKKRVIQVSGQASNNCLASNKSYEYNPDGSLKTKTDWNGSKTLYAYDRNGLKTHEIKNSNGPANSRVAVSYQWINNNGATLLSEIRSGSKIVSFLYDSNQRITRIMTTDSGGAQARSVQYGYNAQGLLASINGSRTDVNDVTSLSYDAAGNLIKVTNALGQQTNITSVDAAGRPLVVVDMNGVSTQFAYDARGLLVGSTLLGVFGNATTTYEYDGVGNLVSINSPLYGKLDYSYDEAHRLIGVTNAIGETINYTLDAMGNRTQENVKSSVGSIVRTQSAVFDELGRVLKNIGAYNEVTKYTYDAGGNPVNMIDPLNRQTNFAFDALNRLIQVTNPLSGITKITYAQNENNRVNQITDPRNVSTLYQYNAHGDVISVNSKDSGVTVYTYDDAGNPTKKIDARGIESNYQYDALNRLTSAAYPSSPTENLILTYDDISNGNFGVGRLAGYNNSNGGRLFFYDSYGNIIKQQDTIGLKQYVTLYQYEIGGNLKQIIYPSGNVVNYTYDTMGRVSGITMQDNLLAIPTPLVSSASYFPFGSLKGFTYGNGIIENKTVDLNYHLINKTINSIVNFTLGYDAVGNILTSTDNLSGLNQIFSYDSLNRLKTASQASGYGSHAYVYDALGNRTNQTINSVTSNYVMQTTSNRIASQNDGFAWTYTYDTNGNITSKTHPDAKNVAGEGWYYTYSASNRLTKVEQETHAIAKNGTVTKTRTTKAIYSYNGKGERTNKTGVTSNNYVYGLRGELLQEEDANNNKIEYIYLNGELLGINQVIPTSVTPPFEDVIVDNGAAGTSSTGTWTTATSTSSYGANYLTATQNIANTYTWTPTLVGGSYSVYARWVANNKNTTAAAYTITHNGITDTVTKNQTTSGAQWVLLGTYTFAAGNNHSVKVTAANGKTVADAIRFTQNVTPTQKLVTSTYYVHNDHLGTPKFATKSTGQVAWKATHTPFGSATVTNDVDGDGKTVTLNVRFPGQYYDVETGLHYNYFRDYDPSTGRYLESDPIGLNGGLNTYAYVGGNPVNFVDPMGLYTEIIIWQPVGRTSSSFGHVSANVNGNNYSWAPGGWDKKSKKADDYAKKQNFRSGAGVILNLTPEQEKKLEACYAQKQESYNFATNNCGDPHKDCLESVLGAPISDSTFPANIGNDLLGSPYYKGSTFYPGPKRGFWDDGWWAR